MLPSCAQRSCSKYTDSSFRSKAVRALQEQLVQHLKACRWFCLTGQDTQERTAGAQLLRRRSLPSFLSSFLPGFLSSFLSFCSFLFLSSPFSFFVYCSFFSFNVLSFPFPSLPFPSFPFLSFPSLPSFLLPFFLSSFLSFFLFLSVSFFLLSFFLFFFLACCLSEERSTVQSYTWSQTVVQCTQTLGKAPNWAFHCGTMRLQDVESDKKLSSAYGKKKHTHTPVMPARALKS